MTAEGMIMLTVRPRISGAYYHRSHMKTIDDLRGALTLRDMAIAQISRLPMGPQLSTAAYEILQRTVATNAGKGDVIAERMKQIEGLYLELKVAYPAISKALHYLSHEVIKEAEAYIPLLNIERYLRELEGLDKQLTPTEAQTA